MLMTPLWLFAKEKNLSADFRISVPKTEYSFRIVQYLPVIFFRTANESQKGFVSVYFSEKSCSDTNPFAVKRILFFIHVDEDISLS